MFYKIDSLITSETVINMLLNDERSKSLDGFVESYQNGREQGHIVKPYLESFKDIAYYICEGRRSDQITIYKGSYVMQSISGDAYQHCHQFGRDFDKAVNWLINDIRKEQSNE